MMDLVLAVASRSRAARTPELAPLRRLVPPNGAGPLFLDPLTPTVTEGVEQVLATGDAELHAELARVCPANRPPTPWVRALADRAPRPWAELRRALRLADSLLVAPRRDRIRRARDTDVAWRSRLLAAGGVEALLTGVAPGAAWRGDALVLPWPHAAEPAGTGAGVTLLACPTWTGTPLFGRDPDGGLLVVHPSVTPPVEGPAPGPDPVAALLGRTRAAVLRALTTPRSTGELAVALGISPAGASQHAAVLRAAGLVATRRDGRRVRHAVTALGELLLS